jgi:hypothetical protein
MLSYHVRSKCIVLHSCMHYAAIPETSEVLVPKAPKQEELGLAGESIERVWVSTQLVGGRQAKLRQ